MFAEDQNVLVVEETILRKSLLSWRALAHLLGPEPPPPKLWSLLTLFVRPQEGLE